MAGPVPRWASRTLLGPLRTAASVRAQPWLQALLVEVGRRADSDPPGALLMLNDVQPRKAGPPDRQVAVLDAAAGLVMQDAGWLGRSRKRFTAAAQAADEADDPEVLAVAALGLGGLWVHEHRSALDRGQVLALQRRALAGLDPSNPVAVRLRLRIHVEQAYVRGDTVGLPGLLDEVRALDAPVALAETLSMVHHCLLGPHHSDARLALAEELIAVSGRTGRRMDALLGLTWRTVDLFLAGDPHAARSLHELRARTDVDPAGCVAYVVAALDVMLAIRAGRFAEAEQLAEHCMALGNDVGDADATGWYGAHVVAVRWYQGRGAEVLRLLQELADSPTMAEPNEAFTAALAVAAAAAGHTAQARGALERLKGTGLASIPHSSNWLVTLFGVAEAADLLNDADTAREAYDLLLPFAERPVMASLAVACFGSVHRALGSAAGAAGDHDAAVRHLEAACSADRRVGNTPSAILASTRLASALRRRGGPADQERATEVERGVAEQVSLLETHGGLPHRPDVLELARDGRDWQVRASTRVAVVRHSVGMAYIAQLMACPGVEVAATQLAVGHAPSALVGRHDVLDSAAKAAYRRRVDLLRRQIEDADDDPTGASQARRELDQLLVTLSRATGLNGRSRAFIDDAERARTSVQKAIRRAVAALSEVDPVLGDRMQHSIMTGMRCLYLPRAHS